VAGSCGHSNENSDCMKGGEFPDQLIEYILSNRTQSASGT
jgi:hypothetical protein